MAEDPLVETWGIMHRMTLLSLENIAPEALEDVAAHGKGRTVGAMLAHLHTTRLMWLEVSAPEHMAGLSKVEKSDTANADSLRAALEASGAAMEQLVRKGVQAGKIKGFKGSVAAFIGYMIAHESYHHGEIGLVLHQNGHKLDDKIAYQMWEWGK